MNLNPFTPKAQTDRNGWFVDQKKSGKSYNDIAFDYFEKTGNRVSPQRIKEIIDRETRK